MSAIAAGAADTGPTVRGSPRSQAVDIQPLATLLSRIETKYHPEQVWLFGSRARGDAQPTSDWDLLVVVPDDTDEHDLDPVVAWRLQRGSGVYADVVPCWAREYREDCGTVNTLAYEVAHEGVLIMSADLLIANGVRREQAGGLDRLNKRFDGKLNELLGDIPGAIGLEAG